MPLILDHQLGHFFSLEGPGTQFVEQFLTELSSSHHISHLSEQESQRHLDVLRPRITVCRETFHELRSLHRQLSDLENHVLDEKNSREYINQIMGKFLANYSVKLDKLVKNVLTIWEDFLVIAHNNVSREDDRRSKAMEVKTEFFLPSNRRISVNKSLINFFKHLLGGYEDLSKKIMQARLPCVIRQFPDTDLGRHFTFPVLPKKPFSETTKRHQLLSHFDKAAYCIWYLRWEPMLTAAADCIKSQIELRSQFHGMTRDDSHASVSQPNGRHLTDRTWLDYYDVNIEPLQGLLQTSLPTLLKLFDVKEFSAVRNSLQLQDDRLMPEYDAIAERPAVSAERCAARPAGNLTWLVDLRDLPAMSPQAGIPPQVGAEQRSNNPFEMVDDRLACDAAVGAAVGVDLPPRGILPGLNFVGQARIQLQQNLSSADQELEANNNIPMGPGVT